MFLKALHHTFLLIMHVLILSLLQLDRSGETNKMLSSYRGFSPGHGILRLHVRDAFIPAHCPLANPSTMTYLQRALPNCPPPDLEISVKNTEPSNILIAAMIHRPSPNVSLISIFFVVRLYMVYLYMVSRASHYVARPS